MCTYKIHIVCTILIVIFGVSYYKISYCEKISDIHFGEIDGNNCINEGHILLLDKNSNLISVKPDGSSKTVIDNGVLNFNVSPDGKWLIAFYNKSAKTNMIYSRLYDLVRGVVYPIAFPEGYWVSPDCWWSEDGQQLNAFSGTTTGGKPLSKPYDLYDYDSKIECIVTLNINTKTFDVNKYKGRFSTLREFLSNEYPAIRSEFTSPNYEYKLLFITNKNPKEYREKTLSDLFLISNNSNKQKLLFHKELNKFGNGIQLTNFAWSPDSTRFVISSYQSGFLKELISSTDYNVYVIDVKSLKWNKIANGYTPYWLKKFPDKLSINKTK